MNITLTTPALLFPTVSLLMLAYNNRFLTLATIIRTLHDRYHANREESLLAQIANLRYRVYLIRNMQIYGVLSLIFCVVSMLALFDPEVEDTGRAANLRKATSVGLLMPFSGS